MESWQELLRKRSIGSLEALVARFGAEHFPDLERLRQAAVNFEFRISPAMVDLIKSPGDPIWRQYVPDLQELDVRDGIVDSLAEDAHSPVPNISHRYPDRALFLVSPVCASYCRFCTRRRKVGDPEKISLSELESAFRYLEEHTEIRDVIMSGGDPLLLSDRRLDELCRRLRAIPHLEILRIGSRVPCHLPERITPELCAILKRYHPLYINTHFNHPDELTPAAVQALGLLADAGIPLGCQTVLLKGVNDDPDVMKRLMQKLLAARVRPYYIYMCDQVAGAEHFKRSGAGPRLLHVALQHGEPAPVHAQEALPRRHRSDRPHQVLHRTSLFHEAARARLERPEQLPLLRERREDDDLRLDTERGEPAHRPEASLAGHGQVHQHGVRSGRVGAGHGFFSRPDLAHHDEIPLLPQ